MSEPKNILVYGDSMSWGIIPGSRQRFNSQQRWPMRLQMHLGEQVRIIEECLNGRTTYLDDPLRPGRNGQDSLRMVLESHSPLDLLIILLGVNDFQAHFNCDAQQSADGLAGLLNIAKNLSPEPMKAPVDILVVIPAEIKQPTGAMAEKFSGAPEKMSGFQNAYRRLLDELRIDYLDLNEYKDISLGDGIHPDEHGHKILAELIAQSLKTKGFHQ